MKHDPSIWSENYDFEEIEGQGLFRLRSSAEGALYCVFQGYETLVGTGSSFDVETSVDVTFSFVCDKECRVFYYRPSVARLDPDLVVYTNIDSMSDQSGTVDEIRRALRLFEFERRQVLRDLRASIPSAAPPASEPVLVEALDVET
jgi:hypothetical protein